VRLIHHLIPVVPTFEVLLACHSCQAMRPSHAGTPAQASIKGAVIPTRSWRAIGHGVWLMSPTLRGGSESSRISTHSTARTMRTSPHTTYHDIHHGIHNVPLPQSPSAFTSSYSADAQIPGSAASPPPDRKLGRTALRGSNVSQPADTISSITKCT
jgi:hypothetical protein